MRKFTRIVSVVLLFCLIVSLLPSMNFTRAAEVTQRYELDTDGIDIGATYLIVNTGSAGEGNALRFYYNNSWNRDLRNQSVTVKTEDGIQYIEAGFTNDTDCQFLFTGAGAGNITHDNYKLDLSNNGFVTGNPSETLTFTHQGNGQYQIHYTSWWRTYYLRYNNSDWSNSTTTSSVYLYKLTDHVVGYDVNYDGNGHTAGTLPENAVMLSSGDQYTVLAPTELRKDVGEDTWLFQCWNTAPDGSGTEYAPGDVITITDDITLYAEWYRQTKYTVSMITYLDGTPMDVEEISGLDKKFFALLENTDTYIPLQRTAEGTYSAKVAENGTYIIYSKIGDGDYEEAHGHKAVIFNQNGSSECMHYSVSYDTAGGVWAEGQNPGKEMHHFQDHVAVINEVPTLAGNRFLGWKDQDGNIYSPGAHLTSAIDKQIILTAIWEKTITVTVNVVIDHKPESGGVNPDKNMHEALLLLLREENGVNLPVEERLLSTGYTYNEETGLTTYTIVFTDMPQGNYHAAGTKSHYESSVSHSEDENGNTVINVNLKYTPNNFDLTFNVIVNADNEAEMALKPQAVNAKILYWGYNDNNELGWHIITQQEGHHAPTTIILDETGKGTAFFPVWCYHSGTEDAYYYRIEVTSVVMPDGTIIPASGDGEVYTVNGSGLYTATVTLENGGETPKFPEAGHTTLHGAYFDDKKQVGTPTITIDITPFTVQLNADNGTVDGQQTITLENQWQYPDLDHYIAVPDAANRVFLCWVDKDGNRVDVQAGTMLTENVTLYARYNDNFVLSGDITVDASYEQNGKTVYINDTDLANSVLVVLQKKFGNVYNDMDSFVVTLTYAKNEAGKYTTGTGTYQFENLPNDGSEYRVQMLELNYSEAYDNNQDQIFSKEEAVAQIDDLNATAKVDAHLTFTPDTYQQAIWVDASQIQKDLRPTGAVVQILYRDLGDVHNYKVIAQHETNGIKVDLDPSKASGLAFEYLWNWHTDGAPYEYQAQISTVYGNNVPGAYDQNGTPYTDDSPFTIVYGPSNNYLRQTALGGIMLEATLVPKEYAVILDLNLGDDTTTPVRGLEKYLVDDGTGNERYVFVHTWSFAEQFSAYPYREGYVFKGWTSPNTDEVYIKDGIIHVGNTLANNITLTAQWEKLTGTDYTIRYLELNTDKVLQGASSVTGASIGDAVVAADFATPIEGYFYAGAVVNGNYLDKSENPVMTVSDNPVKNLMVIYYLPDGSDGYTEQVESNLDINKTAVLEDNGTYTITLDTYTKDNPITTLIEQNTPLDIVLVLDQSGSLAENDNEYLKALQDAVDNFIVSVADHGRHNEVDHRIALVGFASNETDAHSSGNVTATGGKKTDTWINTGVFDSNGEFHLYNVNGFNYTKLADTKTMTADGIYYTKVTVNGQDKYLLLTHHDEYRHLITEEEARVATLQGQKVYGYVYNEQNVGNWVELTRNSSGLWLYGNKQLYSEKEFFTYHTDVWTHRDGINARQIHAYGVGANYTPTDGHEGVFTREETTGNSYMQSIYQDALIPVSIGAAGSGGTNPGLLTAADSLGADGATRASYGMIMANKILEAHRLDSGEDRVRLVVMFTDGEPGYMGFDNSSGDQYYQQAVTEANNAIAQAYISKNTHNAYVYAIGLYESSGVDATSEVAYYMNALSSNYPNAQNMDGIKAATTYKQASNGTALQNNGKFYVLHNNSGSTYYEVKYGYVRTSGSYMSRYCWYYTRNNTNYSISTTTSPTVSNGKVGNFTIYQQAGGYAATENSGYYTTTENSAYLKEYFENILKDITTKITTEIILESDTILRDIMNQGLVLTDDTVITVYTQEGNYDLDTGKITWSVDANGQPVLEKKVSLDLRTGATTAKDDVSGVAIHVYNLDAANPTNPSKDNYHPHAVDITGYNFSEWFISEEHTKGYKMVVTIDRVEAMDDVEWSRSTATNNEQSGLWLPADEHGNRQLLLPFDQPTTIFVERAYVLDYGKEFTLSGWYFDDEDGKNATPVHIDCDISNGMNWFDPENPNTTNAINGKYGNTKYGNVQVKDGMVTYSPTSINWGGYDQFYVFGDTWRKTVLAQDANENGNLWNKVTVIPANNIYYEDSFITTEDTTQNGIQGFTFTGDWTIVGSDSGNPEVPEHMESTPYGDVHGWTDSLSDDLTYTDGSAHATGLNGEMGASAEFTFTGTGVEVYTRTNATSGMVVAVLNRKVTGSDGAESTVLMKSIAVDNLAMSGDYYHIPTVAFKELPYGTYTLRLIATAANMAATGKRYEYYIDGVRIHNPLGNTTNYQSNIIKDAYGLETNAVFTEVRDILLDYGDFNTELPDSTDGKLGAVFIDWIQDGQGSKNDATGTGKPSYEIGTFKTYGPKNEVYLSAGQAIVLKVAEGNTYYVGLKSMTGASVTANVSGIDQAEPTAIKLAHTTDMYYQVTPANGYIVIQNGNTDGAILSITNLRTTNLKAAAPNGGILPVAQQEAVEMVSDFSAYMLEKANTEQITPPPTEPEEEIPSAEDLAQANLEFANALFPTVRQWLETTN